MANDTFCVTFFVFVKNGILSHNLGSINVSKLIKDSKDNSLISKKILA